MRRSINCHLIIEVARFCRNIFSWLILFCRFPRELFSQFGRKQKNHWIFSPQKLLSIYVLCCCQRLCRDCPGGKFFTSFLVKITGKVDTISWIQEYTLWSTSISLTWHPKYLERSEAATLRGSGTRVFLWILWNFQKFLFHRTPRDDWFWQGEKITFTWLLTQLSMPYRTRV